MSVLYITLPIALLMGAIGLYACVRCIAAGQYDDLESPALRILQDDVEIQSKKSSE
ncbi:MAG: cbb3-type cytochrome oxidase assembly protein CcoS [Planctomycetota bacterium]|nr:cbb3-type cytochrome oxidase assembly protein CcoS [Planctomycetota bacterium]